VNCLRYGKHQDLLEVWIVQLAFNLRSSLGKFSSEMQVCIMASQRREEITPVLTKWFLNVLLSCFQPALFGAYNLDQFLQILLLVFRKNSCLFSMKLLYCLPEHFF
jgi:hypothetical protein